MGETLFRDTGAETFVTVFPISFLESESSTGNVFKNVLVQQPTVLLFKSQNFN